MNSRNRMITYEQALTEGRKVLQSASIEEFAVDGFLLLTELLGISRTQYYMKQKDRMQKEAYESYMSAVARRSRHEPLQYITGKVCFMGYDFFVNRNVLIPRMDTEILVIEAEKVIRNYFAKKEYIKVLDMCTGSGCILTALALRNASVNGVGVDISEDALLVAERNAQALHCSSAMFLQSNLFEHVNGTFDMIVSNPPYIKTQVIKELMEEVKSFEPYIALNGQEDGLHFYREITKNAARYLNAGGVLCYEIGCEQAKEVLLLMEENGFQNCRVVKDLAGLDRVCIGNL